MPRRASKELDRLWGCGFDEEAVLLLLRSLPGSTMRVVPSRMNVRIPSSRLPARSGRDGGGPGRLVNATVVGSGGIEALAEEGSTYGREIGKRRRSLEPLCDDRELFVE